MYSSSVSLRLLLAGLCILVFSCSQPTPEKYFDVAVLNSNLVVGFADDGLDRELESPSVKMGKTKDEFVPMKRDEVIQSILQSVEENYEKLKSLPSNNEASAMVNASKDIYEFILPVYKKEYTELAALYDKGADPAAIELKTRQIHDLYSSGFAGRYSQLIALGKQYAAKHKIEVKWNM